MVRRAVLTMAGCSVLILAAVLVWRAYRSDEIVVLPFQWDAAANAWFVEVPGAEGIRLSLRDAFDRIDLEGEHVLEIERDERKETTRFHVGDEISFGGENFRCEAVRRWSGLLFDPMGAPMAAVSVGERGAIEVENVFIRDGTWATVGAGHALRFSWSDAPLPDHLDPLLDARWGVIEGTTTHWFTSFQKGTGIALNDGARLDLVHVDGGLRIHIERLKDGVSKSFTIDAGQTHNGVIFEAPAAKPNSFLLNASGPDRVTAGRYLAGTLVEHRELNTGESWRSDDGFTMRLEQAMKRAAPVFDERSSLAEAVLDSGHQRLRIRQGESFSLNDMRLRFLPAMRPGGGAWELDQTDAHGRTVVVRLRPGEQHTISTADGRFTFGFEDIQPPEGIYTRIRFRPNFATKPNGN